MRILKLIMLLLPALCFADNSVQTPFSTMPVADTSAAEKPVERWYSFQHVIQGGRVFQQNCAVCHGKQGEGALDWRQLGADGKYPAPPLNGSGHAWHHPLKMLFHTVKNGSPGGQGGMPAWGEKLSNDEMIAAIARFQSKWPEQIYSTWMQREIASRSLH